MSWLLALLRAYSLQYQMNKSNVFYVQCWSFGNYPAITNIFAVNQIISYNKVFAITKTPL